jgi:hypothetical protein
MHKTVRRSGPAISLRELAECGSLVDVSVADTEDEHADVEIEQVGGVHETMVFDLEDGRAGYILDLLITNQMPRPFHCRDIEPRMSWPDSEFEWLQDPKETQRDPHNYRFPGRAALELPRDLVLNHILLGGGILKPGCPKQGWLLGIGSPMPANLRHGAWVEMTLTIVAYDHAEYTSIVHLWTQRLEVKPKLAERKYNLYGEKVGRDLGSMVAARDEPGAARDSESVKPIPVSSRWTV